MHGRFFNRRREDTGEHIGEIHAERVVLIARNQLREGHHEQAKKKAV